MPSLSPVVKESIICHRGASALAPENTLEAIRSAAEHNACWIETDVRLTADHQLVMIHDKKLDRTTNGHGLVYLHTLQDIKNLDAGSWFHPRFKGTQVPTLDEFLDCIIENELNLQLELKETPGREDELVDLVINRLNEKWPHGELGFFLSSFSERCLKRLAKRLPNVPLCLGVEAVPIDFEARAEELGVSIIQVQDELLSEVDLQSIAASQIEFGSATVNSAERARKVLDLGIQSVMTDDPNLLAQ